MRFASLTIALTGALWLLAVFLLGTPATAQTDIPASIEPLLGCRELAEADQRLECFDREAGAFAPASEPSDPGTLVAFNGAGEWTSPEFDVDEPWRVIWSSEQSIFTLERRTADGQLDTVIGFKTGGGEGQSDVGEPGTYRLGVRGTGGSWRLTVSPSR